MIVTAAAALRAFFRTDLWIPKGPLPYSGPRDLKQVWFPGVHCDVGGGYPEPESGLSKIALRWMLKEAITAGLLVIPGRMDLVLGRSGAYAVPDTHAEMHDSLTGLWWLADVLLKRHYNWARQKWERRPNLGRRRTIPPSSLIHELAYRRGGDYARRLPPDAISDKLIVVFGASSRFAASVMLCERCHSITAGSRGIICPKIGSFGHWQLSAGETCSP